MLAASIVVAQLVGAPPVSAQQTSDGDRAVIEAFQKARAARDLNRALAQFNDDAVVSVQTTTATQVYAGRDQIRAFLQTVALPRQTLMQSGYRSDGTFVRWTERDEDRSQSVDTAVQAIVDSGRISMLVVQQSEPFLGSAAAGAGASVPSLAWPAALGMLLMLYLGFVFRPRRRRPTSELDGRLLRAMRQAHADTDRAA